MGAPLVLLAVQTITAKPHLTGIGKVVDGNADKSAGANQCIGIGG
ncbi:hypothetical protein EVA_17906, partial [gut metagenome]